MNRKIFTFSTIGLAGMVGVGALTIPSTASPNIGDDAITKREDNVTELVLVDDNDDDDTGDNTRGQTRTRTRGGDEARAAGVDDDGDNTRGQTRTRTRGGHTMSQNTLSNNTMSQDTGTHGGSGSDDTSHD
ncbi:MAG TPA: hypothetical protein VJ819_15595 [Nocardioidaceae bacterium]|nr:hypothetical protein [Nocardioidaceae bacterium]